MGWSTSAFQVASRKMIIAENFIHAIKSFVVAKLVASSGLVDGDGLKNFNVQKDTKLPLRRVGA